MTTLTENLWGSSDFTKSNIQLTEQVHKRNPAKEKCRSFIKTLKHCYLETTVEPCLFIYMVCISLSSLAVQNMHLEKSCRVNLKFGDDICDRLAARNTTGLETELKQVQVLVAKVIAWKFPLQTAIPSVMVLFIGAWSDRMKKRKMFILCPMVGEIVTNIGLLFATYYFEELSLTGTALIEALPPALTGSYIIIFMGMYSFMADRTSVENRTFRIGVVTLFVNLGTPTGTALSGIVLKAIGYYGMFSLLLCLHTMSFFYGLFKLEDVVVSDKEEIKGDEKTSAFMKSVKTVFGLVVNTFTVALKRRENKGRLVIFLILVLHLLMVGPLYGDSQVSYLYAIRRFSFGEVEYSIYGTINSVLGIVGTILSIVILSKKWQVEDSMLGCLGGASRVASCFVMAFAPTRAWFYSGPVFNMFSGTGIMAVRSLATKSVPSQDVAKLSSLMGVAEALAPSIYMPTSSYIFVQTIDNFPGAFYMFDAVLTLLAVLLFFVLYMFVRQKKMVKMIKKEEFARHNEISRI